MSETTAKRIHLSMTNRDMQLIGELKACLCETQSGIIRRSVEHYHNEIINKHKEETK